jgi:hypothetical protein
MSYVSYKLHTESGSPGGGGRFGFRLTRVLLIEPSLVGFVAKTSDAASSPYFISDVSAIADVDDWRLSPIAGLGVGAAFGAEENPRGFAIHALTGVRYRLDPKWALRFDLKFRSIEQGSGKTFEAIFGITRRHK